MKTLYYALLSTFLSTFLFLTPDSAHAAPPRFDMLTGVFDSVFGLILPIGGLLAVGMLVYGGYMWMISAGDSQKISTAQGTITWAILGLVFLAIFRIVLVEIFDFIAGK